jgi:GTP-binding protein
MTLTVAIIGRPNVGKSTLFNRLTGRRLAIVDDEPGVTRDRRYGLAKLGDLEFTAIDTAGLEDAHDDSLGARMREQSELALDEADAAILLVDAKAGVTPIDAAFAKRLRKRSTPIVLVANKCEGKAGEAGLADAHRLGLGEPIAISAEHGQGLGDLYDALASIARGRETARERAPKTPDAFLSETTEDEAPAPDILQLAIVGRPNVGKSTLVNSLLGEDRMLTGPEAGITRDAIAIDWRWRGRPVRLIDTAGLRRRARVESKVERLSGAESERAIRFAHVVVLVLDARDMLEKQDLAIAAHVIEEGRALVIAANKWDAIDDKPAALRKLRDRIDSSLPQAAGVPIATISALGGRNLDKLMTAVFNIFDQWNRRVPTAKLNRFLESALAAHPPPLVRGRRVKPRYMTQIKARPPTFALFAAQADALPESYARYLVNGIRTAFDFKGVPIRLYLRSGENPFDRKR